MVLLILACILIFTIIEKGLPCWWNIDCKEAVKNRKKAYSNFRLAGSKDSFIEHRRACAHAKKVFKLSRKKKWEKFCKELKESPDCFSFWKMFNHFNNFGTANNFSNLDQDKIINLAHKLSPHGLALSQKFHLRQLL